MYFFSYLSLLKISGLTEAKRRQRCLQTLCLASAGTIDTSQTKREKDWRCLCSVSWQKMTSTQTQRVATINTLLSSPLSPALWALWLAAAQSRPWMTGMTAAALHLRKLWKTSEQTDEEVCQLRPLLKHKLPSFLPLALVLNDRGGTEEEQGWMKNCRQGGTHHFIIT